MAALTPVETPWARPAAEVAADLAVDPARGLAAAEAEERLRRLGPNEMPKARPRSAWSILFAQLRNPMALLLGAAAVLAFAMIDWVEGVAILVVIAINTAIGFATELDAVRSMEALRRLGQATARVRRDGRLRELPASELVPGDMVSIEGGDVVAADLRLVEASRLQADESALTGESVPVDKTPDPAGADSALAERACMLYKGTAVTRGAASGVVVATGPRTELGRIASLVESTQASATPLERRLDALTRRMIAATLAIAAALAAIGLLTGRELATTLETAIALAVAAVPEGLPVVATIALARGMWRMARHNALVNRLSAVETLGATGVICTDKTGTLTENRMSVARILVAGSSWRASGRAGALALEAASPDPSCCAPPGAAAAPDPERDRRERDAGGASDALRGPAPREAARAALEQALAAGVLCNDAELQSGPAGASVGDPLEAALLESAAASGLDRARLLARFPRVREDAFDSAVKMMATVHRDGDAFHVAVKGAPEAVLGACERVLCEDVERPLDDLARRAWLDANRALGDDGLRVIALARRDAPQDPGDPYARLTLLGLVGLADPPRPDVRAAIEACRSAGIEVVMVTGDQPATARHVAVAVGLIDDGGAPTVTGPELAAAERRGEADAERMRQARILARVSPEQKLDLIAVHQEAGHVVAMTGDGVNDAPALKKADIGIAMGIRGTQVARDAADMVLKDDAFATIVEAIRQGRVIFDNIRKFVVYLLSCNLSEVLVVSAATLAAAPLPLLPLQILFLNLVTDVFPALALGVGRGDPSIMRRAPRPADEPILARRHWIGIALLAAAITASTLGAFATAILVLELDLQAATSISFLTLAVAQLLHVFNMRAPRAGLLVNDVTRNPWVWLALAACAAMIAAAVAWPPLAAVLQVVAPDRGGWAVVAGFALAPLLLGQLAGALPRRRGPRARARGGAVV